MNLVRRLRLHEGIAAALSNDPRPVTKLMDEAADRIEGSKPVSVGKNKPWVSRPITREDLGVFRLIPSRRVGVIAANLATIAQEIKAMSGPWPSRETLGRIETLDIAARYLTTTVVKADQITLRAVKQNKMRKKKLS